MADDRLYKIQQALQGLSMRPTGSGLTQPVYDNSCYARLFGVDNKYFTDSVEEGTLLVCSYFGKAMMFEVQKYTKFLNDAQMIKEIPGSLIDAMTFRSCKLTSMAVIQLRHCRFPTEQESLDYYVRVKSV